jgi:PAS domain S-box-containing protein
MSVGSWDVQGQRFVSRVIRDITERKKAEAALRQSESSLRALIENALYGIYRSTPEGRFLAANPALVEMLGCDSEAEVLNLDMAEDVYARAADRAKLVREFSGADRIDGVEASWRRKDRSLFSVRLSGRPVHDPAGQVQYFEMVAEDVTERRALENQLRHAQKMEAIGQLTAGIAHDFNNILTAILANTELLHEALPPQPTELRQDVDEIGKAARRATDMIKQLMTFGRREQLDRSPLDLNQFVRQVSSMLRRLLPENIEIRLETGNAGFAHANPSAMEQILLNLATNARDAMPAGGVLRIETRHAVLDEQYRTTHGWGVPGQYECLSVSDTGAGMDARTRERIFEPFFTTKPQGQGTGLGLAMVYGLVKQHAGYINVYSEPGLGTTFRIYVPRSTEEQVLPQASISEDLPTGTETILVVEDEAAIRRSVRRILERQGYRVLAAENGQQAMDFLRDHGPSLDLVITDLIMPKLSGMQLFEAAQTQGFGVKFLFTSGYSDADLSKVGPEGRDVPFLRKPWTVVELLSKVRHAIDQPHGAVDRRP